AGPKSWREANEQRRRYVRPALPAGAAFLCAAYCADGAAVVTSSKPRNHDDQRYRLPRGRNAGGRNAFDLLAVVQHRGRTSGGRGNEERNSGDRRSTLSGASPKRRRYPGEHVLYGDLPTQRWDGGMLERIDLGKDTVVVIRLLRSSSPASFSPGP